MGCEVTRIHEIIEFDQKDFFKPYVQRCISQRKRYKDIPILSQLFKLLSNSYYGRTILNSRKYDTSVSIVRAKTLGRSLNNPRIREIRLIAEGIFAVTKSKRTVSLDAPIYIGPPCYS